MISKNLSETLSRTVKMALDSGEASTLEEAEIIFYNYQLIIEVGSSVSTSPTLQAALLTAVNAGRRAFLGGVSVCGCFDFNLLIPWKECKTIESAVIDLKGRVLQAAPADHPRIIIGNVEHPSGFGDFAVRATFDGWVGGVIPLDEARWLPEKQEFTPSGVLAGALAVAEAFQYVRGGNPMAGRRAVGLSLWRPEPGEDWLESSDPGPLLQYLPAKLWLIGLGHLGQSFLWTLGFLPFASPKEVSLVLQDFDLLSDANDSTSPLTFAPVKNERKTRAIATWCEQRGFQVLINERLFAGNFTVADHEPMVAICGVDNAIARSALEDVGFARVIEAGLGKGEHEYLEFQVHTFPSHYTAQKQWGGHSNDSQTSHDDLKPAYKALKQEGMDECGLATLAGRSVGACFVGMVTSTLMIAELLRMAHGAHAYSLIDGSLRSLHRRQTIINEKWSEPFNPGITDIRD